jgi:peptidoglycan/LPS O-acetylase OafA/YrhL
MKAVRVAQILDPKQNNFNLLRLLAAGAVVVSHAVFLRSGSKADEIFSTISYYNLGDHAVNVFFVLSGLTVAASLARSQTTAGFLIARSLRIFPALAACAILLVLLGAMVTVCAPAEFLADTRVWRYGLKTLLLGSASIGLPGVFADNPHPTVANASIWTLKFEVACYAVLALVGAVGFLNKSRFAWLLAVSWTAVSSLLLLRFGYEAVLIDQAARFWLCFSFGASLYVFRVHVPLSMFGVFALIFMFWLTIGTGWERIISPIATGYSAVWLAKVPIGWLRDLTNQVDLSYGIYIFGWPISQTLLLIWPNIGTFALVSFALIFAACVAVPSWLLIERPALRARSSVMRLLGSVLETIPEWRRPSLS